MPAKLVIKDTNSASRLWLARRMAESLAGALPGRSINYVEDSVELFYERDGERCGIHLKRLPDRLPG